jgi:uncharacterized protein YkwD
MSGTRASDTANVASARRAYTATRRHLPALAVCASLFALCVGCCLIASTAPAAPAAPLAQRLASHVSAPAPAHHKRHCAKPSNFQSSGGHPTLHKHRAGCRRHRVGHHRSSAHHAPAGACSGTDLRPNSQDLERIRLATLCLVNRERTARGESALHGDNDLQKAAQVHSADMAAGDYFEHNGRSGDTPLSRMRAAGYIFSSHIGYQVGENIAWATLWMASPREIVIGWMKSPGHRANILDRSFRDTGIGVAPHPLASLARGQAGAIYTQDFGHIIR